MNATHYDHQKLARTRKGSGLTQDQLAEELGVTSVTISRVENGVSASYELLNRIALRLGHRITDFLYEHPAEDKKISIAS